MSARERALEQNSLVCLLQALKGHVTRVELRNESVAEGIIADVDAYTNVTMSQVSFTAVAAAPVLFDELYISGRNVRFVQIPDEINILTAIKQQLAIHKRILTHSRKERVYSTKKPKARIIAEAKKEAEEKEKLLQVDNAKAKKPVNTEGSS